MQADRAMNSDEKDRCMKLLYGSVMLLALLLVNGCGPMTAFPPEVTEGADTNFDFNAWWALPKATVGRKVQLGGRIIQVNERNEGFVIIAAHLPVVEHPAYGPRDIGKRAGEYAIFYAGAITPKSLRPGNRLMVIGTTEQSQVVNVDEVQRNIPSLTAQCLHIWNTGGKEIAEFPYNAGAGYEPLEENTFCLSDR
ncbi:MAG: Slp family lipoprotein [Nitrospira sp.]|nr:Slp family lipoprotein [Nitrospira sp.]